MNLLSAAHLLLVSVAVHADFQCSSPAATDYRITVTSRRNQTGHWIAEVQMDHDGSGTADSGPWELRVEQSTSSCSRSQTVRIDLNAIAPPRSNPVADDYKLVPGVGSYKLHTTPQSWDEARITCEGEGAHLLVLDSDVEVDVVKQMFRENPAVKPRDIAWIGVHDLFSEGKYVTILGQTLEFKGHVKWDPEDQEDTADRVLEDCICIDQEGKFLDGPCATKIIFFCER